MSSTAIADEGGADAGARRHPPRWLWTLVRSDIWLTGTFFVILTVVTFLGVVMRYFFNDPFVWLEEVQLALFLGVVYLGGGAAFRHGSHVAIDFLVERFPPALSKAVALLVHVVVVGVLAFFVFQGAQMAAGMAETGRSTNILKIPSVLIYAMVPVGLVWAILNYLFTVVYGEEDVPEASF